MSTVAQKPSRWNPNAIRRTVRETVSLDGLHAYETKSFTKPEGEWHPMVDLGTGEVSCDCPHYIYRCKPHGGVCKHIERAIAQLKRKGEMQ